MHSLPSSNSMAIVHNHKSFSAAKCRKCGAKMYPKSLLRPHLTRHQRKDLWFAMELSKLRNTFARMRDIA
jgi:NAD-dependent SIR2 family protein deacetylase